MTQTNALPRYRSHKVVQAAKIIDVNLSGSGKSSLTLDGDVLLLAERGYIEKHNPQLGGYFVLYEDGYQSYSLAAAFESGYVPLPELGGCSGGVGDNQQEVERRNIERAARTAHEVNRAYCAALGDHSQPNWEDAPDWQKDSAIEGVVFHLNGDHPPEASHNKWLEFKKQDGWKYGPVKDAEKKEHPCFVPYDQLPKEQQVKDYLFRAVVHAFK
ncbi:MULTISPECIES: RyR domain-containing protein [Pectobacterium]|uniref:RyR domain-containing protein n=1 Tax=Pectobacterium TaxID=122277 RepID=UPI001B383616|nr:MULTISPECIES: RyR domain-containing protein [Pectobacterium]MBQ4788065.1 hypothetical protein [Pectobacterium versatile]UVD99393.1 RyR domain-containing protein [Pectobacterium parvum]